MASRIRYDQTRLAIILDDQADSAQIANAIPSSITQEDYQRFFLSRMKQILFGNQLGEHWYSNFDLAGLLSLQALSHRKTGVVLLGVKDGINRDFTTPDKFIHDPLVTGQTIEVFHNGRRLIQASSSDVRLGDYFVSESGGVGSGFNTVNFLSFTPSGRSVMVSDYLVA